MLQRAYSTVNPSPSVSNNSEAYASKLPENHEEMFTSKILEILKHSLKNLTKLEDKLNLSIGT